MLLSGFRRLFAFGLIHFRRLRPQLRHIPAAHKTCRIAQQPKMHGGIRQLVGVLIALQLFGGTGQRTVQTPQKGAVAVLYRTCLRIQINVR